ncbi:MAG: PilZ domain-containing protein [Nitrospira sp.]|nr:PilZ domain-containing protein [Nitrospira sp.]
MESRINSRRSFNKTISFELSLIESDQIKNIKSAGTGVDISPDGLGISINYALAVGDVLKLNIPDNKEKSANAVFAEVVWSKPSNSHFRMGLRFLR